jgi:hypothetical protein
MKTIPAAMTWELLARGRWSILAALLATIALPGMTLGALSAISQVDPFNREMIAVHMILGQIGMFIVGATVFVATGRMSRLYAYPARTSTLVAWRMGPAMAIAAMTFAAATAVINALFHLGWPVWSTACFLAVVVAAVQAATWLTERSLWSVFAVTVVAMLSGVWLRSRYGPLVGEPTRLWTDLTAVEVFTMLVAAIAAYAVAVYGVARNRRGEPPFSVGIVDRLAALFARRTAPVLEHPSPDHAQRWHEWQRKGWVAPMIVGSVLVIALPVWATTNRNPRELVEGLVAGGFMLTIAGCLAGLIFGHPGGKDGDFTLGGFLATRPMTNSRLASATLITAAQSLLMAWFIWLVVFLATLAVLATILRLPKQILPAELGWWYFPITLIGPWTAAAIVMTAGLTGRSKLFFQLAAAAAAGYITLAVISNYALTTGAQRWLDYALAVTVGVALVGSVAWLYTAALKRRMIRPATLVAVACVWAITTAIAVTQWPTGGDQSLLPAFALAAGLLALAVAPFAAAPLAMAWNRHR